MKLSHVMGMGLLALAPMTGFAAGIGNNVDAYYVSSGLDIGPDDDGDGLGVKGQFAFADQFFFSGEYQTVSFDDFNIDVDQVRLGVGINSDARKQLVFFGLAEFIHLDYDFDDDNGIGLHGGAIYKVRMAAGKSSPLILPAALSASARLPKGPTRTRMRLPSLVSATFV